MSFEDKKYSLETAETINDVWNNPVTKTLVNACKFLAPLSDVIENGIGKLIAEHQKKKLEELLEAILSDGMITTQQVEDVTVIMEFAKMVDVVNRLASNDKIKYLGNLFKNTIKSNEINFVEYEEFLAKINDLSYRELDIIKILYEVQKNNSLGIIGKCTENEVGFNPADTWNLFVKEAKQIMGLTEGEITAIVSGIMRSGFVQYIPINYAIGIKGVYVTTPYFEKFLKTITE